MAEVDFAHQVVPILRQHCAECHSGDVKKGGFSINDQAALLAGSENGPMVVRGKSSESDLIELVTSTDPDLQMPPKGARLTDKEVAVLRSWIDEGLKWEAGFAFKKPAYEPPLELRKPDLPPPMDGRLHPIDRIVDRYQADRKIPRPAKLDDLSFLRRTSLDLVGMLPELETVQAFEENDSPDKRVQWIVSLLADDIGYAEHWMNFWNDLLRNDYGGTGFITGGRKQISNWLYRSLVENKPYDQFARELIAPQSDESRGFIDGIKWRGDVSAGQTVEIQFAQSVAQSFLGINMKCNSCHDSFIDRWKLKEAYGLAAIYSTRPLEIARCDMPTGEQAEAAWIFPEMGTIDADASQPERLKQLASLMTSSQNGRFARTIANRLWYRLMGRGIVHPLDAMQSEPWSVELLDHLASQLVDDGYDLKKLLFHMATSQTYQSHSQVVESEMSGDEYQYRGPRSKRLTSEQFVDAVWSLTGAAPKKYDAPILRGKIDVDASRKIQLAGKWIWEGAAEEEPGTDEKPGTAEKKRADEEPGTAEKKRADEEPGTAEEKRKDEEPETAEKKLAAEEPGVPEKKRTEEKPGDEGKEVSKPARAKVLLFRKKLAIQGSVAVAGALVTAQQSYTLFVNNREVAKDDDAGSVEMIPIHQQLRPGNNTVVIVANGTKDNPLVGGVYFEARLLLEDGNLMTLASDDTWEVTQSLPVMNEKRLKALDESEFKPVALIEAPPEWSAAVIAQGPILLSQTMSVGGRMIRASLLKSDFLMRTLGRPNRDQIVSMRPNELTTLEAIDLANGPKLAELVAAGAERLAGMQWKDNESLVMHMYRSALTREPTAEELTTAKASLGDIPTHTTIEDLLWAICMTPEFFYVR